MMADETTTAAEETEEEREAREMISFGIIASAGQARSLAFEALKAARTNDFETAGKLLAESRDASLEAHHQQTKLLSKEAAGEHTPVDVMLVHAQDHLMTAMLAQELIGELVNLYKVKEDKGE